MGNVSKGSAGLSVVFCLPGDTEAKHAVLTGNELEAMQLLVGGYIEKVGELPYGDGVVLDVYCNEDGMRLKLPSNRLVYIPGRGAIPILGIILISAANPRTGEQVSMDEGMIAEANEHVRTWPMPPIPRPVFKATVLR